MLCLCLTSVVLWLKSVSMDDAATWFVFLLCIHLRYFFLYHSGVFAPDIATSYWQMIIFLALMEIPLVHSSPGIIIYLL